MPIVRMCETAARSVIATVIQPGYDGYDCVLRVCATR